MCKVSFFVLNKTYLALGSKNVTVVVCVTSKAEAQADLKVYEEERYQFALEMAEVFLEPGLGTLRETHRETHRDST